MLDTSEFVPNAQRWQQVQASVTTNFWLWLPVGAVIKTSPSTSRRHRVRRDSRAYCRRSFWILHDVVGLYTSITTKTDAPADLTAYRTLHAMTSSTVTHTVETGRNYLITFTGDDDSTDISTGLFVYRPLVSVEIGSLRPSDMAVTAISFSPEIVA